LKEIDVKCKLQKYAACRDLITHFGVIALFSSKFKNFNTFRPLFQKLYEIDVKFKLQKCAPCRVGRSWHAEHVCSFNLPSVSYSFWNKGRKVLKFGKIWWKKGNNSKMGHGIYFKIAG
jgi:hypothetical protein